MTGGRNKTLHEDPAWESRTENQTSSPVLSSHRATWEALEALRKWSPAFQKDEGRLSNMPAEGLTRSYTEGRYVELGGRKWKCKIQSHFRCFGSKKNILNDCRRHHRKWTEDNFKDQGSSKTQDSTATFRGGNYDFIKWCLSFVLSSRITLEM